MAMVRLAVSLPCHTGQNVEATYWLGVVAFGRQADLLAKHQKGDLVSVAGNMQLNQWAGQDGVQKEQPQVIADSVISARTVRPGGNQHKSTGKKPPAQAATPNHDEPPFPDDIPF